MGRNKIDPVLGIAGQQPSDWCLVRLRHALQALAQPAEIQLSLLPDSVVKADELALDFDNWYQCVRPYEGFLTPEQEKALDAIDQQLREISGPANSHLWTEIALSEASVWKRIRNLATAALPAFGWPNEVSPSHAHEYISGSDIGEGPK